MNALKKLAGSSAVTIGALLLALALLGFSTIGGARAALTYYSEDYISTMQLHEIGVSLRENGDPVATVTDILIEGTETQTVSKDLLQHLVAVDKDGKPTEVFKLGGRYPEVLTVFNPENNGDRQNITQYLRVTIYRYWSETAEGDTAQTIKRQELDPTYIQLWLNGAELGADAGAAALAQNNWLVDAGASTPERLVLYYALPVDPNNETLPFADQFSIDRQAGLDIIEHREGSAVTTEYLYDDVDFNLEIRVDAVQNHNAAEAILSAWGRAVQIDETNRLSLVG